MKPAHVSPQPLYLVALNEVNFDFVSYFMRRGVNCRLAGLIAKHGVTETISEDSPDFVEPWIQWATVHTGLSYAQHGLFRLGDAVSSPLVQIWEHLQRTYGCKVGAVAPMNAANRSPAPSFFVPDPWTATEVTGDPRLCRLARAISTLVNENATGRAPLGSYVALLEGILGFAPYGGGLPAALRRAARALRDRTARAILLDELLADMFEALIGRHRPDFASLFLNAAAHLQHRYLLASPAYRGNARNPGWYVGAGVDPLLEAYSAYDRFLARLRRRAPDARLLIATGLHQIPIDRPVYYWRLKDHEGFLRAVGCPFDRIETRMSRDFLLVARDERQAEQAAAVLLKCRGQAGEAFFDVDNRGANLFVTLSWPHDVPDDLVLQHAAGEMRGLRQHLAFVALKNGLHDGTGSIDTGQRPTAPVKLTSLFDRIDAHFAAREPALAAA